jgi:cytochrome c-type biogenesis protein CcmH
MRFLTAFMITFLASAPVLSQEQSGEVRPQGELVGGSYDEAHAIGLLLRCPVCQGMPISDSPADMAQSMMAKVRTMHKEGQSEEDILKYFTDRYGDWVLLRPTVGGFNWLVWGLPPFVLLLGILTALMRSKRVPKEQAHDDPAVEPTQDEYLQAIRNEVQL